MASKDIELADDRDSLPFSVDPLARATEPTLADIAASVDRLIGMQLILAEKVERLDARIGAIHQEMQSNMNAYLGWTREFAGRIKAK